MFFNLKPGRLIELPSGSFLNENEILQKIDQRCAYFTACGIKHQDRVFFHMSNCAEFFLDLLAIWEIGGCVIPIDTRLTEYEIGNLVNAAKPKFSIFADAPVDTFASQLENAGIHVLSLHNLDKGKQVAGMIRKSQKSNFSMDDDALILFTSGTTGDPKGVVHTHRSLRAQWIGLYRSLGIRSFCRSLCLLPTHFGHGLICNSLFPWMFGQDLYIAPPFDATLLMRLGRLLDENKITFMSSVPSMWRIALKTSQPPGSGSVQRVFCGSAPLSADLWRNIKEWTGADEVVNAYGITETGSWLAGTTVEDYTPENGLIGIPWGGVIKVARTKTTDRSLNVEDECEAEESGYVWVQTPALMKGYFKRQDLTARVVRDGWFLTGDIGLKDNRGFLYLKGREREEINKGGMKIYPGDIDNIAERFSATQDVCTFGYDDPLLGQNIGIALVLKQKDEQDLAKLYRFMAEHLAKHQMPQKWFLVSEIPRTSRGKINREKVALACADIAPTDFQRLPG